MPPRTKHDTDPDTAAEPGTSPVPGKPLSQVEAEAPPEGETAELWDAEFESRWPYETEPAAAEEAEEDAERDARKAAEHHREREHAT